MQRVEDAMYVVLPCGVDSVGIVMLCGVEPYWMIVRVLGTAALQ